MMVPDIILTIAEAIQRQGGRAYVVGGWCRDYHYGQPSKDIDIEVHGMESSILEEVLKSYGEVDAVGKSFGVYKLSIYGEVYDFSLPRTEIPTGNKHTDFAVKVDPMLGVREAASRRDFTMNAIYYSIVDDRWVDPFDGIKAIQYGELTPCSPAFKEDALRVLRGAYLIARFGCYPSSTTLDYCLDAEVQRKFDLLPSERIWGEWEKILVKGEFFWAALDFLRRVDLLRRWKYMGELITTPQNPKYHPEGNVLIHTAQVMQRMHDITKGMDTTKRLSLMLSAMLHDVGKAVKTLPDFTAVGHDDPQYCRETMEDLGVTPFDLRDQVACLVEHHMLGKFEANNGKTPTTRQVKNLSRKLAKGNVTIEDWALLNMADSGKHEDSYKQWVTIAETVGVVNKPETNFVTGKDLLAMGMVQGKALGDVLRYLEQLQMADAFATREEALVVAQQKVQEVLGG